MMTDITYPPSYYRSIGQGLHDRWCSTMKEMKAASAPVQYIFREELKDIYSDAHRLYANSFDFLDPLCKSQLEHILSRPIEQHFAIVTCH